MPLRAHHPRSIYKCWLAGLMSAAAWLFLPGVAAAETLNDALLAAYSQNPQLSAERARLRATDENVARANSGFRPRIEGNAFAGLRKYDLTPSFFQDEDVDIKGYQVTVSQPVFRGLRTINSVRQAEELSAAGQETLKAVEARTLLGAVMAYGDVLRDQMILSLRRDNVRSLSGLVTASEARLRAEDATKADVSQAKARRARASAEEDLAEANLRASEASFEEVIGHTPHGLSQPGELFHALLPPTLEAATTLTQRENPNVYAALHREVAASHAIDTVRGELLPEVSLEGSWTHTFDTEPGQDRLEDGLLVGRVRIPLYEGGEVHARVRQAKQEHLAAIQDIRTSRASAMTGIVASWTRLKAARAQVKANEQQITAAETALKSVQEEEKIGSRTVLDVLNAQQELIDAKISAATARRDVLVAGFQVLAITGQLTIAQLGSPAGVYDPAAHLDDVRRKWVGTEILEDDRFAIEPFAGKADEAAFASQNHPVVEGWDATHVVKNPEPAPTVTTSFNAPPIVAISPKVKPQIAAAADDTVPSIAVGRLAIARSSRLNMRSPIVADAKMQMKQKTPSKRPEKAVREIKPKGHMPASTSTALAFKPTL